MKKLNLPYIGIKIESLPTILKILSKSKNDAEFLDYFIKMGKAKKTASEYLASLRNLKLAQKDKNKQTIINSAGLNLINDDIEFFYKNLLNHCIKHFPDLRFVREIIKKHKPFSLKELKKVLENDGYFLKRQVTLSSYFKLFYEAEIKENNKKRQPFIGLDKTIEYNQFVKFIATMTHSNKTKEFTIKDLRNYLNLNLQKKKTSIPEDTLAEYLQNLQREKKIKLYQVNSSSVTDTSVGMNIAGKFYYTFEVIKNGI